MIDHQSYAGSNHQTGVNGKKVAIVGYSHYVSDHTEDSEDFTIECVRKLLACEWQKDPIFFRLITKAFSITDYHELWPNIMFFKWAPHGMGGKAEKFNNLSEEGNKRAAERFKEILTNWQPDVVLIFTSKINPSQFDATFSPFPEPLTHFSVGRIGGTRVYRLRHTQGARAAELLRAVSHAIGHE